MKLSSCHHVTKISAQILKDIIFKFDFSFLSIYGGLVYRNNDARLSREMGCDLNQALPQEIRDRCMKYRKTLFNARDYIDIPEEVDNDKHFRSTVGHKVLLVKLLAYSL